MNELIVTCECDTGFSLSPAFREADRTALFPMAYKFKKGRLNGKAVRRICFEQIDRALSVIGSGNFTPEAVHECRKVVKRLRAVLRLVEPRLGREEFKTCYRGVGRIGDLLAEAREQHVLQETFAKLGARLTPEAAAVLVPLKSHIEKARLENPAVVDPELAAHLKERLVDERGRLDVVRFRRKGFSLFAPGLCNTYALARANLKRARKAPSDENLHELRKAVQWHWRQMALFASAWPGYFSFHIDTCRQLAEVLGDDHDLSVLREELKSVTGLEADQREAIDTLLTKRQWELRNEALPVCARIFAEKPADFLTRVAACWHAKGKVAAAPAAPGEAAGAGQPVPLEAARKVQSAPRLVRKERKEPQSQGAH